MRIARALIAGSLVGLLAVSPANAGAAVRADVIAGAASFIASRQRSDGGFFREGAPADGVAEVIGVLAAADAQRGARARAMRYLARSAGARARDRAGYAGRIVQALVASREDPRSFAGTDFVAILQGFYDEVTGKYDTGIYANALAALGVLAAGEPLSERAITFFRLHRCRGGGFGHEEGCLGGADVDTTSLVVATLRAAGVARDDEVIADARAWLLTVRNADGGFGARPGDETNANSTGLAVCAVVAMGEDPERGPWRANGAGPLDALLGLRHRGGGFRYLAAQDDPNDYATVQALPAMAGMTYPLRAPAEKRTPEGESPRTTSQIGARAGPDDGEGVEAAAAVPERRGVIENAARADADTAIEGVPPASGRRGGSRDSLPWAVALLALGAAPIVWRGARARRSR